MISLMSVARKGRVFQFVTKTGFVLIQQFSEISLARLVSNIYIDNFVN